MKYFVSVFPKDTNPDIEMYIDFDKVSKFFLCRTHENKWRLWLCIGDNSFHYADFHSKSDAKEKIQELIFLSKGNA